MHRTFAIKAFSCDSPALQFLKNIKGHTGFYACERCVIRGEYTKRRTVCDGLDFDERNGECFQTYQYNGTH